MSTGEKSAEEILTSKSEDMELCDLNTKNPAEEIEIIYSHIKKNTETFEEIGSTNSVETSSKIDTKNESSADRFGFSTENESIQANAVTKHAEITLLDITDEVECEKVVETDIAADQLKANDLPKPTNLTESTFGLITEDPSIHKPAPMIENLNSAESRGQSDVTATSDNAAQLDDKSDKTCQKTDAIIRVETKTINSLSSLAAEYASSESDDEEMIPSPTEVITIVDDFDYKKQNETQYRSKTTNDDSASEDTDSDSDTSDESEDSEDSDSESENAVEDGPDNVSRTQPSKMKKSKSEFEDLPPIEELKITVSEELCDRLGEVSGIVEQLVIVRPISGKPTLNLDSILFLEKGNRVLGRVFDVFGQVADPHYCVRFNSEEHIKQSGIVLGMEVYFSPNTEHTSLVFLHELVKLKGVDVSGEDDIEPPEFSDDEEERAYNQLQRQKQRQKPGINERQENSDAEGLPQKRQCHERQRNPWSSDWPSRNYNNPRSNRNFGQGPPRWNPENSQPPFQNAFSSQNPVYPSNQPPSDQYAPPNTFNASQYQFNPYDNPYQQNNMFPPPNPGYIFGRSPGFRPNFNNYGPNIYRSGPYPPPPMSWTPPPPPPPPPPSM